MRFFLSFDLFFGALNNRLSSLEFFLNALPPHPEDFLRPNNPFLPVYFFFWKALRFFFLLAVKCCVFFL